MTERPKGKSRAARRGKSPGRGRGKAARDGGRRLSPLARLGRMLGLRWGPRSLGPGQSASDVHRIARSGLFDAEFYAAQLDGKPEWPAGGQHLSEAELIEHYLREGAAEWLNPSRGFDTGLYLQDHAEAADVGRNPLLRFLDAATSPAATETGSENDDASEPVRAIMSRAVAHTPRAFVVPATLAPRNTTRYRVAHLVELVGEDRLTVVDPQSPPEAFFAELDRGAMVILQRLALTEANRDLVARIRSRAALVAYDIDDQIFDANELETWRIRDLGHAPGQYARCMDLADHFLVSTPGLRQKIEARFRRPAHVLVNCLGRELVDLSTAARDARDGTAGPFILGYASGSHTHDEDLRVALPAVEAFLRANPRAEFHAIGDMDFPDSLRAAFGDRVHYQKAVPWRQLPAVLAGFSVQIIPLVDCPFNRCKSHIRVLEAAAVGVPSIVSQVGEPDERVVDGVTGLSCRDDPAAWQRAMQRLHDDAALRQRLADAALRFTLGNFTSDAPPARRRVARILDELGLAQLPG